MKRYHPDRMCPKCGSGDIDSLYYPASKRQFDRDTGKELTASEQIKRICRRCLYSWPEKPLSDN